MRKLLDRSDLEDRNSQLASQVEGQAKSQILQEEDAEFESPFTKRGLYTQQKQDTESDLSIAFDNIDAFMYQSQKTSEANRWNA